MVGAKCSFPTLQAGSLGDSNLENYVVRRKLVGCDWLAHGILRA